MAVSNAEKPRYLQIIHKKFSFRTNPLRMICDAQRFWTGETPIKAVWPFQMLKNRATCK